RNHSVDQIRWHIVQGQWQAVLTSARVDLGNFHRLQTNQRYCAVVAVTGNAVDAASEYIHFYEKAGLFAIPEIKTAGPQLDNAVTHAVFARTTDTVGAAITQTLKRVDDVVGADWSTHIKFERTGVD